MYFYYMAGSWLACAMSFELPECMVSMCLLAWSFDLLCVCNALLFFAVNNR